MKYSLTVLQWNTQVLAEFEANTLKEINVFIKKEFKRNLGQKQHFKNNCQAVVKAYTKDTLKMIKDCPDGCYIPKCNRQRNIIKIKNYRSSDFKSYKN